MRKTLAICMLAAAVIGTAPACSMPNSTGDAPSSEPTTLSVEPTAPLETSAAPAEPATIEMPPVEGESLTAAMGILQDLGLMNVAPVPVDGHAFVANPANWVVVAQDPAAGTQVSTTDEATLEVAKTDEAESEWCGDGEC